MAPLLLVTRPQPEADETAALARAQGFRALVAPLLVIRPLAPAPLDEAVDAILLTSARSVPLAAAIYPELVGALPAFAVGPATAAAADRAGFRLEGIGASDGQAALALASPYHRVLHLRGEDGAPLLPPPGVRLVTRILYRAEPVPALDPCAVEALCREPRVAVLLFSPRTARIFAARAAEAGLLRSDIRILCLSEAVAEAAEGGWRQRMVAPAPTASDCMAAAARMWQARAGVEEGARRGA
jgi:uroporphyrinogen-III synthase